MAAASRLGGVAMTPRRTGFSLIETLVAMAMSAVMVTVAITTITLMMRSERTGTDALIAAQSGHRFERRFRDDVHAAAAAVVDTSQQPPFAETGRKRPTRHHLESCQRRTPPHRGEPTFPRRHLPTVRHRSRVHAEFGWPTLPTSATCDNHRHSRNRQRATRSRCLAHETHDRAEL